jgi:serine/threonine protein kinase
MIAERPKYRVLHELGAGGMGLVWKGYLVGQGGFQRPIVIKQLKQADDPGHVQLFVDEARRYALLDHENIGRIFDFDRVDGELCIILEYIDGWTLVEYLRRHRDQEKRLDIDLSVFMASRVCRALQYVFERAKIVHRDISPSNIMMTREGTVKLIDFGIATLSGTRDLALTGKPAYMAPEMVTDLRADNRSDLFSLGTVLYELLTGQRLFRAETTADVLVKVVSEPILSVRSLRPDIPEAVEGIVRRALERDPVLRFGSAAEMGEACEHYLYDKGYGPTNLTLKRYVGRLFPEAPPLASEAAFPIIEPTLLPLFDSKRPSRLGTGEGNRGSSPSSYTRVITQRPDTAGLPEMTTRAGGTLPRMSTLPTTVKPAVTAVPRRRSVARAPARATGRGTGPKVGGRGGRKGKGSRRRPRQ